MDLPWETSTLVEIYFGVGGEEEDLSARDNGTMANPRQQLVAYLGKQLRMNMLLLRHNRASPCTASLPVLNP
jgi:hypothetical protein